MQLLHSAQIWVLQVSGCGRYATIKSSVQWSHAHFTRQYVFPDLGNHRYVNTETSLDLGDLIIVQGLGRDFSKMAKSRNCTETKCQIYSKKTQTDCFGMGVILLYQNGVVAIISNKTLPKDALLQRFTVGLPSECINFKPESCSSLSHSIMYDSDSFVYSIASQ